MGKHKLPTRIENSEKLCEYGCNRVAYYKLGNGKWCCESRYHKCPTKRKIQSSAQKNRDDLFEQGQRLGKSNIGRTLSKDVRKKLSIIHKKIAANPEERKRRSEKQIEYWETLTDDKRQKYIDKRTMSIEKMHKKYPFFSKIENMRYEPGSMRTIQVRCKNSNCKNSKEKNGWFTPTKRQIELRIYSLENPNGNDGGYFYCSDSCKTECPLFGLDPRIHIIQTSKTIYDDEPIPDWIRQKVIKRDNNKCLYCGNNDELHVHHIYPVKKFPQLKFDVEFMITVCRECHFKYAHKDECSTNELANFSC